MRQAILPLHQLKTQNSNSLAMGIMVLLLSFATNASTAPSNNQLDIIYVTESQDKSIAGKDKVYLKDNVTEYKSKKEIETFHSHSVADLISGVTGVYSGDARNGGAIDPIIRSTWGQGRIPVLVDDTEQAITIWRGYSGVNNRNYLDPFLISEVEVEKGPNLDRSLRTGAGGTVRMKTLNADDIIKDGQKWGIELKTETANNSVKRQNYQGPAMGQDYRLVASDGSAELGEWAVYFKDNETIKPRKKGRNKLLKDNAVRLAVAVKEDNYELLGAYAYRNKGNYFSGKRGGNKYGQNLTTPPDYQWLNSDDPYIPLIAKIYHPGDEVPNTSYDSKSWLLKGKYNFSDSFKMSTNFRHSKIQYGDIMPSRLGAMLLRDDGVVREWPQANVKQTTASVDFAYNPADNKWIDVKLGLWSVWNRTETNTSGGSPSDVLFYDKLFGYDRAGLFNVVSERENVDLISILADVNYPPEKLKYYQDLLLKETRKLGQEFVKNNLGAPNLNGLLNTQRAHVQFARDKHQGITFSNRFNLHPKLNLDVMANYRRESLNSTNVYELWDKYNLIKSSWEETEHNCLDEGKYGEKASNICRTDNSAKSGNRKGKRNEFTAGFKFEYQPTDWLILTAGMKYTHYKSKDIGLQEKIRDLKPEDRFYGARIPIIASVYKPYGTYTEEQMRNWVSYQKNQDRMSELSNRFSDLINNETINPHTNLPYDYSDYEQYLTDNNYVYPTDEERETSDFEAFETEKVTHYWERDAYGRFSVDTFPLNDGRISQAMLNEKTKHPLTGEEVNKYHVGMEDTTRPERIPLTLAQWEKMKKAERKDHAWAPSFGATLFLSPNARLYARYDETKRMPSIFEDTIGYSIDILTPFYKRKPEHSKNIEIGYSHDLRGFFPSLERADIRLNWYRNTTRNIFDRDETYEMKQFEKRILEGLELQARYDQGNFFGDLGISYNLKNKFCDRGSAITDGGSIENNKLVSMPVCVNGGNANGYLKNTILPKYSITSNLGVRLLERKLEIGTRMVYHTNVKETRNKSLRDAGWFANTNNNPRWQPVFLVDAYMNYQVNPNVLFSLSVTNLTDRYYLDPMTKSSMPAPGRTLKLGLTATF
ncbi:TonB-dependent receptor domain-containing protein [Ursidibacter sp. B-7004-1]